MTGDGAAINETAFLLGSSERALRIYFLDMREVLVIQVVLDWSFRRGRLEALIPELDYFTRLTGLDKGDLSKVISRLGDRQILQVKELGRDHRGSKVRSYRFRPEASWWQDAPLRVDVDDMLDAVRELERFVELGRDVEPSGQRRIFPIEDDDFSDGLSAASREAVLKDAAPSGGAQSKVAAGIVPGSQCEVPAARRVGGQPRLCSHAPPVGTGGVGDSPTHGGVGELPTHAAVGDSPTGPSAARVCVRDDLNDRKDQRSNDHKIVRGVAKKSREGHSNSFRDPQKQAVWLRVESMCSCEGWWRYWWVGKVSHLPTDLMKTALSDVEFYLKNNRCQKAPSALLWKRIQEIAKDMRINSPALESERK